MSLRPVICCEHGGNRVPHRFAPVFEDHRDVLHGHRGHDPGALALARSLAYRLAAPLFFSTTTRLLVDLNRSLHHRGLFSEFTRPLPRELRAEILAEHYAPYRARAQQAVAGIVAAGDRAVHLSAHSFTPIMRDRERRVDVGLLFDPARARERAFCEKVRAALVSRRGDLRVRFNQPYRGTADGFTTALRKQFAPESYLGIEIEVNQRFPLAHPGDWPAVARAVIDSVEDALEA